MSGTMSDPSLNDQHYLQPSMQMSSKDMAGNHDSGISSLGQVNRAYLSTPDSEMESSFSDEQKLSSSKPYLASKSVRDADPVTRYNTGESTELSLPPPPGNMWAPLVGQSHSADGVIGGHPSWMPSYPYIHPAMVQQHSLPQLASAGGLTAEEHQMLLKYRQERQKKGSNRESLSPDGEGGHLYEELPGYQYKTHHQMRRGLPPLDGKAPPHLPPISSLPSSSQASGLDILDDQSLTEVSQTGKKKENPLYEVNDTPAAIPEFQQKPAESSQSDLSYVSRRSCRCYSVILLLVAITAAAALFIALASALGAINIRSSSLTAADPKTGASTGSNLTGSSLDQIMDDVTALILQVENQNEMINELNTKLLEMEAEKIALETRLVQTNKNLLMSLNESNYKISALNDSLLMTNNDVTSLGLDIQQVNNSLGVAIYNVSKMPGPAGPEGPSGFLDPTLCTIDFKEYGIESPHNLTISTGSVSDTNEKKVISASCSWEFYDGARLTVTDLSGGLKSYECHCRNALKRDVVCKMDYWLCDIPT